jgi:uncharacterized protein YggE
MGLALAMATRAAAAGAENCGTAAAGPPVLRLSETATESVIPSELVADLGAVASAASAVGAERRVNEEMASAKKLAAGTPGVSAAFRGYTTSFVEAAGKPAHWIASETLEIRGQSGETVLGLVGRLQASGLAVGELEWRVAPEAAEAARRAATLAALKALRTEAAEAAGALGLAVQGYRSISLSGPVAMPLRTHPVLRAMATAMPPPQASAEQQQISATVSAEVVLGPTAGQAKRP